MTCANETNILECIQPQSRNPEIISHMLEDVDVSVNIYNSEMSIFF